jgi:hypothetical protein
VVRYDDQPGDQEQRVEDDRRSAQHLEVAPGGQGDGAGDTGSYGGGETPAGQREGQARPAVLIVIAAANASTSWEKPQVGTPYSRAKTAAPAE